MAEQRGGGSNRTVMIALVANLAVAILKGVGGMLSGSSALLSEAAHSVADTLNELLLWIALRRGEKDADELHPFGYGMARFFYSLLAAFGIFIAGGMFSLFEGYQTVTGGSSEGDTGFIIPYVVLALAFVAEGTSFLRAVRQLRGEARGAGREILDYLRVSDDPTVKTVASEDSAALVGLLIAFLGVLLNQLTGSNVWQAIASFLIGALLIVVAFGLGLDNGSMLIGESADPRLRQQLMEALRGYDEVDEVIELLTMRIGTRRLLVAVRLDFAPSVSSDQIEELSTRIDKELHQRFPVVDQLFLDATSREPERGDRADRVRLPERSTTSAAGGSPAKRHVASRWLINHPRK